MSRQKSFLWSEYRKRMLAETSRYIEWGLRHPELTAEIPAKPVGDGGFPQKVAEWFWGVMLTEQGDGRLRRWRDRLLRRPRIRIGRHRR